MDDDIALLTSDLPGWLVGTAAFVFGALWGSFFNVAIYRWPRGMSVVKPPSHCPACGAPVAWYLNVPILGYLLLRGRAGCCGARLSPRYAWVELPSGVLCLGLAVQLVLEVERPLLPALVELALYFAFAGGLVIATFVDLEWMEIPDEVSLPGAALGLASVGLRTAPGPVDAAVGAGLGFLVVQLPFVWAYEVLLGRRGMGEGDAKLLMMIGAFLGWEAVLFCLVAGSMQGLVVAGVATLAGVPLVPKLPDDDAASDSPPSGDDPLAVEPPGTRAQDAAPASPAMMVFGPMLAVSALEFLFFRDAVLGLLPPGERTSTTRPVQNNSRKPFRCRVVKARARPADPTAEAELAPRPDGGEDSGLDPELVVLAPPPQAQRFLALTVMAAAVVALLALVAGLRGDMAYALRDAQPQNLGAVNAIAAADLSSNAYVRLSGVPTVARSVQFRQGFGTIHRVFPLAGQTNVYVGVQERGGESFVRSEFTGRLVTFGDLGARYAELARVMQQSRLPVSSETFLLLVDERPRDYRWAWVVGMLSLAFIVLDAFFIVRWFKPLRWAQVGPSKRS